MDILKNNTIRIHNNFHLFVTAAIEMSTGQSMTVSYFPFDSIWLVKKKIFASPVSLSSDKLVKVKFCSEEFLIFVDFSK